MVIFANVTMHTRGYAYAYLSHRFEIDVYNCNQDGYVTISLHIFELVLVRWFPPVYNCITISNTSSISIIAILLIIIIIKWHYDFTAACTRVQFL